MKKLLKSKIAILILLSFCIFAIGCKSRKVLITHSDSTSVKKENTVVEKEVKKVDTTKTKSKSVSISSDSGRVITTITPSDSTGIFKIDNNGSFTFTGKIKNVVVDKKYKIDNQSTTTLAINNGISTTLKLDSTTLKLDSTKVIKDSKTVDAKADHSWIYLIIGLIALILIVGFCALKFWFKII